MKVLVIPLIALLVSGTALGAEPPVTPPVPLTKKVVLTDSNKPMQPLKPVTSR